MGTKSVDKPRNDTWNWLLKLIFINVGLGFILRLCTYCYKKNKEYPWPWFKYICSNSTLSLSSILNITKTVEKTIEKYNWDICCGKVIIFFLNYGMYCIIFGSENFWFSNTLFELTIFWYCIRTSPSQENGKYKIGRVTAVNYQGHGGINPYSQLIQHKITKFIIFLHYLTDIRMVY